MSVGSGGEHFGVNVIWRTDDELWYEAIVNTDDHEEHYLALWSSGHAHYGSEHRHVDVGIELMEVTGETGETEPIWWLYTGVATPDEVHPPHLP